MKTTVILGAGFSKNAGLPVQAEISNLLIGNSGDNKFDQTVTSVIKAFMSNVFGYKDGENVPSLDDMLTCIDISTNSGHHLGMEYSPQHLRAVRRLIVYKLFSILDRKFKPAGEIDKFIEFVSRDDFDVSYVVLNWDIVLEKYLMAGQPAVDIDYCNDGINWHSGQDTAPSAKVKLYKTHGSCNWLYCDNCRALFYDLNNSFSAADRAGFMEDDFRLFREFDVLAGDEKIVCSKKCKLCGNSISSHIATFSYRKTFRANSFPDIWSRAEEALAHSDKWIFIGYSLPDPDYEFKHLLKIAELKLRHVKPCALSIDIVSQGSKSTITKYRNFFGKGINYICTEGLKGYVNYLLTKSNI